MFQIEEDFIKVTIPFSSERYFGSSIIGQKDEQKDEQKYLTKSEQIKNTIISKIRHNPNITTNHLMKMLSLGKTSIQNYLRELTKQGLIEHVGSKRGGYWKAIECKGDGKNEKNN